MAEAENKWKSMTLGQNKTIQEIAAAAAKASDLLTTNVKLAQTTMHVAAAFLLALLNPYVLLLRMVADLIDDYVKDFKDIGFYVLEVTDKEGKYGIPQDADKNPIKLFKSSRDIITARALAMAANQGAQFAMWAKDTLGESNILLTGPQKAEYEIEIGKAYKEGPDNQNDNVLGEYNPILNMYTMTPSIVVATMIAAMDDKADLRRPQFSSNAEAGAIVLIIGVSDLTKNLATIKDTIDAFKLFFGGEERKDPQGKIIAPGGIIPAMGKLGTLVNAALLQIENPDSNNVTIKVKNVCGVRGTEDDKPRVNAVGKAANYEKRFEVGDYVAGPRVKFGSRCMGYVSQINSEKQDEDTTDKYGKKPFYSQELTITGLTDLDKIGWQNLSSGASLQLVAFKEKSVTHIDQNSGETITRGPFNDFEYISNLSIEEAKVAKTQVVREPNKTLLTPLTSVDVTEVHTIKSKHTPGFGGSTEPFTTLNTTVGDIFESKIESEQHPNFKAVKLEDFIEDFASFFMAIDALTDALRKMADDAGAAIKALIAYLDAKIKELEEINTALQKILALFTIGLGDAGLYVLNIPMSTGGNDYIKKQLQSATNKPPDTLEFTIGFLIVGGGVGSASTGFKTLQKLLVS